jgi:hypothetical protein
MRALSMLLRVALTLQPRYHHLQEDRRWNAIITNNDAHGRVQKVPPELALANCSYQMRLFTRHGNRGTEFQRGLSRPEFVGHGHVYPEVGQGHAAEYYKQPRLLYWNRGNGQFYDLSSKGGPGISDSHSSRGVAVGDLDNDGKELFWST